MGPRQALEAGFVSLEAVLRGRCRGSAAASSDRDAVSQPYQPGRPAGCGTPARFGRLTTRLTDSAAGQEPHDALRSAGAMLHEFDQAGAHHADAPARIVGVMDGAPCRYLAMLQAAADRHPHLRPGRGKDVASAERAGLATDGNGGSRHGNVPKHGPDVPDRLATSGIADRDLRAADRATAPGLVHRSCRRPRQFRYQ